MNSKADEISKQSQKILNSSFFKRKALDIQLNKIYQIED